MELTVIVERTAMDTIVTLLGTGCRACYDPSWDMAASIVELKRDSQKSGNTLREGRTGRNEHVGTRRRDPSGTTSLLGLAGKFGAIRPGKSAREGHTGSEGTHWQG